MLNLKFQYKRSTFSFLIFHFLFLILFASCSVQQQITKSAKAEVLDTKALQTAHVGISIFEPAINKYWFNYQGDKYFVPASNTKLPTCYAAMKYLGDSLVGLRYNTDDSLKYIVFQPTSDPTFLHPDFKNQKVYDLLKKVKGNIYISEYNSNETPLGNGWAWNDYMESYMAERSEMPMYGNVVRLQGKLRKLKVEPRYFWWTIRVDSACCSIEGDENLFTRRMQTNEFFIKGDAKKEYNITIPFHTRELGILERLLGDTLKTDKINSSPNIMLYINGFAHKIYSQPTDSVLKPMMHRSDNFFAEQLLLMVSNEMFVAKDQISGGANDENIIDTLLKTDFKDLPQKPRWVDGSGLSRYNLFTPQDFVAILNKMKNEFGMERIKVILPTGGEGTISSYYKADSGYIYGKTGTLSGVVAFSGFLYTKKGKLLIFSTLVNNHQASATEVRRTMEKFLQGIRNKY